MRATTEEAFAPALIIADYGAILDDASPEAISREILAISDAVSAQAGSSGGSVYGFNNIDGTAFVSIQQVMVSFDYRYAYVHEAIDFSETYFSGVDDVDIVARTLGGIATDLGDLANEVFVGTRAETSYIFDAFEGRVVATDQFFTSTDIAFVFDIEDLSDLTFEQSNRTGDYQESVFRDFLESVGETQGLANGLVNHTPDNNGDFDFDGAMDRLEEVPDNYTLVAQDGARSILLFFDFEDGFDFQVDAIHLIGVDLATETVTVQDISDDFGLSGGDATPDLSVISFDRAITSPDLSFSGLYFRDQLGEEVGEEFLVARLFDTQTIDDVADSREHALAIGAGVDQIIFSGDEIERSSAATRADEDWFVLPASPGAEGYVVEIRGAGDFVVEIFLGEDEAPIAIADDFGGALQPVVRFDVPADHDGPVYAMVRGFNGGDVGAYELVFTPPQDPTGGFDTPVALPSGSQVTEVLDEGASHFYRVGALNTEDAGRIAQIRPVTADEFEDQGVPAAAADPLTGAVLNHYNDAGVLIASSTSGELTNVFSGFVEVLAGDDPAGAYVFDYL